MARWKVIYYETADGVCPCKEFIDHRNHRDQAKVLAWLSQLEDRGPHLPRPYADLLEDGIHELRVQLSGQHVRLLYFFCFREFIVLTHAFTKQTGIVPQTEIERARRYRTDLLYRYDESNLRREYDENA